MNAGKWGARHKYLDNSNGKIWNDLEFHKRRWDGGNVDCIVNENDQEVTGQICAGKTVTQQKPLLK